MLKLIVIVSFALSATSGPADCVEYEVWKGGDDGLTNRAFDQIVDYNRELQPCADQSLCKKAYILVTQITDADEGGNIVSIPIGIYENADDKGSKKADFTVKCDLRRKTCGKVVFEELNRLRR